MRGCFALLYVIYKVYDGCECAGEWRHADVRSCTDMASLSEYEQLLSICERGGGSVICQRHADTHVTDTVARVRGEWRHAVGMSNVDAEPLLEYEQPLSIREGDAGPVVSA